MIRSTLYILTTIILLSCDKKNPSTQTTTPVAPKSEPAEVLVKEFVATTPFTLQNASGNTLLELSNDKQVYVYGAPKAQIDGEGAIMSLDGSVIAKLNHGNILVNHHQMPLIKMKEDGTVDYGSGVVLHWSKDGELMHGDKRLNCKIQPFKKESLKTAGMLYYYFLFRK